MIKNVIAEIEFRMGRLLGSDRLLQSAARRNPHNMRASLELGRAGQGEAISTFAVRALAGVREHSLITGLDGESRTFLRLLIEHLESTRGQMFQEIAVLQFTDHRRSGYFVEIGTGNGESLSNTYLLEKHYDWRGIVFEPDRRFHQSIQEKRTAILDTQPVYSQDDVPIQFLEVGRAGELSTLITHRKTDGRYRSGKTYETRTTTLTSALRKHGAPKTIDYVSIDTEGSELEVLKGIDFDAYDIRFLTIEHNYVPGKKEELARFLSPYGFRPVLQDFSAQDIWLTRDRPSCSKAA